MINRYARIIDDLVDDTEWIGLRRTAEVVDRLRPISLPTGVDFVDRADLAWLRVGDQILVLETIPCRRIAPEGLARIRRVGAGPWLHVHDADFEDVARLGPADVHRASANVHAESLARAAPEQLAVDGPSAATIDAFLFPGP